MKTDAQLKADVMSELEWDPLVNAAKVSVEVKNGVVTLIGRIDTHAEKHAIERAVQRVAGDMKVKHGWVTLAGETGWNRRPGQARAGSGAMAALRGSMDSWARRSTAAEANGAAQQPQPGEGFTLRPPSQR